MTLKQIRSANFGMNKANLTGSTGVGYSLLNSDGSVNLARTTTGVYQLTSGSGIYASNISFAEPFNGSILWDTGEAVPALLYASEQYNVEENDGRILPMLTLVSASVDFIRSIEGGGWTIDAVAKQMILFKSDNTTEVARFNLLDSNGVPTTDAPFRRTRV